MLIALYLEEFEAVKLMFLSDDRYYISNLDFGISF